MSLFKIIAALFLFFITLLTTFSMADSKPHTINSFLSSAGQDYRLNNHSELVSYTESAPSSTPYLDKVELRTETEEFYREKQKYAVRLYPKGWGETTYNRQLNKTKRESVRLEHDVYFNKALKQRYEMILGYLETASRIRSKKELLTVFDDKIKVLKKMSGSDMVFDVNTLIEAEDQYVDMQLDLVKIENQMTGLIHKINLAAGDYAGISFDETRLIDIETIESVVRELNADPNVDNIYLKDQKNKIVTAKNKYNIEKAKNRDYLSFAQVAYDSDDSDESRKAYSVQLAFKLPFINPDREEVSRRKFNYLKQKLNYEEVKRSTSEQVVSLSRSVKRLITQSRILMNRKTNGNAQHSFKTYMEMEGINPLNLLKLKESMLKNNIQLNQLNYLIRYRFIELMDILGNLSEKPLKNYVSVTMEEIL